MTSICVACSPTRALNSLRVAEGSYVSYLTVTVSPSSSVFLSRAVCAWSRERITHEFGQSTSCNSLPAANEFGLTVRGATMTVGFLPLLIDLIFDLITVSVKSSDPESSEISKATVVVIITGKTLLTAPNASIANTHAVIGIREVAPKNEAIPSITIKI